MQHLEDFCNLYVPYIRHEYVLAIWMRMCLSSGFFLFATDC